ncbi:MAG: type II secretion system F family protein [Nitrospiria bacterium]
MALYNYQATDAKGKSVNGLMEARDENVLVSKLQEMGYFPIKIDLPSETVNPPAALSFSTPFPKRISSRSVTNFTGELCSMMEAGFPLDRSLSILAELEENRSFKAVILDIHKGIHSGANLADCLEKHPSLFSEIYVSTVRAGETGGTLEATLARNKKYMEETDKLKEDIKSALIYPLLLTTVGGSALAVMLFFVVPKFSAIFASTGSVMPLPTRILLSVSQGFGHYWWVGLSLAVLGYFLFKGILKTDGGKLWVDRFKLKLPVFGMIMKKGVVSRFARTLGTLIQGGIPILDALGIAVKTMGNRAMVREILPVIDGIRKGRGFTVPLKETGSFPPLAVHMLTIGEETGKLDETLIKLADNYDRDISVAIKRLLLLLEPVIILVMALLVGFIVISLLLAIFGMNDLPM